MDNFDPYDAGAKDKGIYAMRRGNARLTTDRYAKGGPRCEVVGHKLEVQTRSVQGELRFFPTVKEAFAEAEKNQDIYKVSFGLTSGERVRLVRGEDNRFFYEDIMTEVLKNLEKDDDA